MRRIAKWDSSGMVPSGSNVSVVKLFILFCLFIATSAGAQESTPTLNDHVLFLQQTNGSYELTGRYLLIAEDKENSWNIQDVRALTPTTWFRVHDKETPSFGITPSAYWLKFTLCVMDSSVPRQPWLLEVAYSPLSELDLYTPADSGVWKKTSGGNLHPFQDREIKYRNQMFSLDLHPRVPKTYYLRVRALGSTVIPLRLYTFSSFARQNLKESLLAGVFYGAVLLMIVYTIALFLSERDLSYLYYACYATSYGLFQAGNDGLSFQFLWPESTSWNYSAVLVFAGCIYFFNVLFTRSYLQTKAALPRLDNILIVLAGVGLCITVSPLFVGFPLADKALTAFIVPIALFFYLLVAILRVRQGSRPARYYGPALTLFMIGFLLRSLRINGVVEHTLVTEYSAQFGVLSELALLAFGLGDRFHTFRQQEVNLTAELKIKELETGQLKHTAELEHVKSEKLLEMNQLSSRFFANISHEFRTPLAMILGPIQKWKERSIERLSRAASTGETGVSPYSELHNDMSMAERNAQRLLRLISQLLDLSKLESGRMNLQASRGDVVPFVRGIANSFESSTGRRGITLTVEAEPESIEVYFDRDKLEKILVNLLSNAFKFTPEGGAVNVSIHLGRGDQPNVPAKGEYVEIVVADTGIGIPGDQLDKIFNRFYQVDASQTREHEGSGIGLALTKELVELHYGTITVQSEVGKGTTFILRFPPGRTHLAPDEIIEEITNTKPQVPTPSVIDQPVSSPQSTVTDPPSTDIPLVLVIEDNADVRSYIKDYLVPAYRFEEARDGTEGMKKAVELIPDLVVSDVMMPKMDGNEVCRKLKQDERTSHIPVILLTAKAGHENKLEGLEAGADDYLTKPFDAKELLMRMRNLIEQRRSLREKFSTGKVLKPGEIAVTSMDDQFLQKAMAVVEQRMADENFSVEEFAEDVGMSRSQLHRKLRALTNQSPSDFMRYMRLHRAKQLIERNAGTISEIAFQAGFSSVAYFTKSFHEQFGMTPSAIKKSHP